MKRKKIEKRLKKARKKRTVANVYFRFLRDDYENLLPLSFGEDLFLCSKDWDFMLDGYSIFNLKDVKTVKLKTGLYNKIMAEEGITTVRSVPDIDLSSWRTVFASLSKIDGYVIVENQSKKADERRFAIGNIEKVGKKCVHILYFDADGEWDGPLPWKIPYNAITNVDFARRYITYYSKYVKTPPNT